MRIYTVHARGDAPPRLVREGFSWGALLLGPIWFAARRSWIMAGLTLAAFLAVPLLARFEGLAMLALGLLLGLSAGDLVRFELALKGWRLADVVAAHDEDAAFARLLDARPEFVSRPEVPGPEPAPAPVRA